MTGSRQIPVAEGLFTWPADDPRLIGARCAGCGLVGFPAGPACQRCGGTEASQTLLPDRGTLWTFTTQDSGRRARPTTAPTRPKPSGRTRWVTSSCPAWSWSRPG